MAGSINKFSRAARGFWKELREGKASGRMSVFMGKRPAARASEVQWNNLQGWAGALTQYWSGAQPTVDARVLAFFSQAGFLDAHLSNARKFLKHLVVTELKTVIDDRPEAEMERIYNRLNELAARVQRRAGGLTGLALRYADQMIMTGAISAEDVLTPDLKAVANVALVPVQSIEFALEDGEWIPYQKSLRGEQRIKLAGRTYRYYALESAENSPYAIPPFLAAARHVLMIADADDNIRFAFKKFGLLGLVTFLMDMPENYDWENPEHLSKFQAAITQRAAELDRNFKEGLLVGPKDGEFNVSTPAQDVRGAADLMDRKIEHAYSGMGVNAALVGQSNRPVQTMAGVMYRFTVRMGESIQMLLAQAISETQQNDLELGGMNAAGVRSEFKRNPAFDPLAEAQGFTTELTGDIRAIQTGLASPDEIAQKHYGHPAVDGELAYQAAEPTAFLRGEEKLEATKVNFSGRVLKLKGNQFEFERENAGRLDTKTKHRLQGNEGAELAGTLEERRAEEFVRRYLGRIRPLTDEARARAVAAVAEFLERSAFREFAGQEEFASRALQYLEGAFGTAMERPEVARAAQEMTEEIYRHYRLEDRSAWRVRAPMRFRFGAVDARVLGFAGRADNYFVSTFIGSESARTSGRRFLEEQYITGREGLFGRGSPQVTAGFREALGGHLDNMSLRQAQTIVDTSVVRLRNYAELNQFREFGIERGRWVTVGGACQICAPYNGRIFAVANALARVDRELEMTPAEFEDYLKGRRQGVRVDPQRSLEAEGESPPLHPNCKCMIVAEN